MADTVDKDGILTMVDPAREGGREDVEDAMEGGPVVLVPGRTGERKVEAYLLMFDRAFDAAARRARVGAGCGLIPLGGGWILGTPFDVIEPESRGEGSGREGDQFV